MHRNVPSAAQCHFRTPQEASQAPNRQIPSISANYGDKREGIGLKTIPLATFFLLLRTLFDQEVDPASVEYPDLGRVSWRYYVQFVWPLLVGVFIPPLLHGTLHWTVLSLRRWVIRGAPFNSLIEDQRSQWKLQNIGYRGITVPLLSIVMERLPYCFYDLVENLHTWLWEGVNIYQESLSLTRSQYWTG